MKKVILFFFILSSTANGAVPTMEGLFRNGLNPTHKEGAFVSAKVRVHFESLTNTKATDAAQTQKLYMRLLFFLNDLENPRLLQTIHHSSSFLPSSTLKTVIISNLAKKIKYDSSENRSLFFSLLTMFFLNSSKSIVAVIKKNDPFFMTNIEALNEKGVKLYKRYAWHLKRKRKDSSQDHSAYEHKLREEKRLYDNRSLYNRNKSIKLIKKMNRFFWSIHLQHFTALFSNEKHQLHKLRLDTPNGSIKVHIDRFKRFQGSYELPYEIIFEDTNGRKVVITLLDFKVFNKSKKYFSAMTKKYLTFEKKDGDSTDQWQHLLRQGFFVY